MLPRRKRPSLREPVRSLLPRKSKAAQHLPPLPFMIHLFFLRKYHQLVFSPYYAGRNLARENSVGVFFLISLTILKPSRGSVSSKDLAENAKR